MALIPETRRPPRDQHDAVLKLVETVLNPMSPQARAKWARRYLPKTFAFTLADRDFDELSR